MSYELRNTRDLICESVAAILKNRICQNFLNFFSVPKMPKITQRKDNQLNMNYGCAKNAKNCAKSAKKSVHFGTKCQKCQNKCHEFTL